MIPISRLLSGILTLCLCIPLIAGATGEDEFSAAHKTLIWHSPGLNSLGSVPLGNGDIGVNAWVDKSGDLLFYVAKSDAWCENGRLLKLGRIRVSLSPSLVTDGAGFRQTLDLNNGSLEIVWSGERQQDARSGNRVESGLTPGSKSSSASDAARRPARGTASRATRDPDSRTVTIRLWVDALNPVINAEIHASAPVQARITVELWRKDRRQIVSPEEMHSAYGLNGPDGPPVFVEPDSILPHTTDRLAWLHRNRRSVWRSNLLLQGLDSIAASAPDPLLHRTFGCVVNGAALRAVSDTVLQSDIPRKHIVVSVYPHTSTEVSADRWLGEVLRRSNAVARIPAKERFERHRRWWNGFWDRSHLIVSSQDPAFAATASTVTRGHMLQRYINACAGRGAMPIKFNGSLFTVDTYDRTGPTGGFDPDFRQWGGPYWFQNTRLPYWGMLQAGDSDLMTPLFATYAAALPLRTHAARRYYGHEGAFYPETMNFWGTYTDANYGRNRTGMPDGLTENTYIRYYWTAGLELSLLMLDRAAFDWSAPFVRDTLIPVASGILTFFDRHWPRDAGGIIRFEPAQALETYQVAVNPAPDVAGLRAVAERMLALPDSVTTAAQRVEWRHLLRSLPPLPLRVAGGDTLLAPAGEYGPSSNIENPELYAVFPFRIFGVGKEGLELARRSYAARVYTMNGGWQQHAIQAAYLGLTQEAAHLVADNFGRWDTLCRFPAFWGPNYDWTPDQDHGSVAVIALQRMLLQYEGDAILLLPSWPKEWDAEFRLHAPRNTVVEGRVRSGKLERLDVRPASRRRDVSVPAGWD